MKKIIPLICSLFLFAVHPAKAQFYELWGTTYWGGLNGSGVIMNIGEDTGAFAFPYSFDEPSGEFPSGNLLYDKDSIFYGMTLSGGADSEGVLYSYDPVKGIYTDLRDFDSTNGSFTFGSLIQDTAGIVYGMTSSGGAHNFGVIFSYNPDSNRYTHLHDFDSIKGEAPYGSLTWAKNGNAYGMTSLGGTNNDGVIFNFNTLTHNIIKLYDFVDSTGMRPTGDVIIDSNKLYGMTSLGGANNDGVIFSFNLSTNTYTDLLDFNYSNGSNPTGSLLKASNGKLYGMAENGVDSVSDGVIFSYNPDSNKYTILFVFDEMDGGNPGGTFIQGANGKLYALTQTGGVFDNGVLFSFDPDSNLYNEIYDLNNAVGGNPYGSLTETPYIQSAAGIASISKNKFSIFPNPSSGLITVISPNTIDTIKITDLLGRVIYTSNPNLNKLTLNIKEAGMYFITLTSAKQTITQKIIISR